MADQRIPSRRETSITTDEALYDGVQPWMSNSLRNWLSNKFCVKSNNKTYYQDKLMHDVELHARLTFGTASDGFYLYRGAMAVFNANTYHALDMIQAVVELEEVTKDGYRSTLPPINYLNELLIAGGSKWHVVVEGKHARMEARVDQTTEKAYKTLAQQKTNFSELLTKAWNYCYGRQPNPSEAYTYAIKAVEAASWATITPNNTTATLGTLIKDLESQTGAGKFTTIFNDKEENAGIQTVISVMQRLWHGHSDRHATGTHVKPTEPEAEAAIHLAILLCHLFSTGSVIRK